MKNIFVLPTDKASRLFLNKVNNSLLLEDISNPNFKKILPSGTYQNIYITSDEEIKDGDWFLGLQNQILKATDKDIYGGYERKIILTTDQDLISDGIEQISEDVLLKILEHVNSGKNIESFDEL